MKKITFDPVNIWLLIIGNLMLVKQGKKIHKKNIGYI
jgi:hypothetical protein